MAFTTDAPKFSPRWYAEFQAFHAEQAYNSVIAGRVTDESIAPSVEEEAASPKSVARQNVKQVRLARQAKVTSTEAIEGAGA